MCKFNAFFFFFTKKFKSQNTDDNEHFEELESKIYSNEERSLDGDE